MSLFIRRDGEDYINFINASVTKSMENVCGAFTFNTTVDENNRFPMKMGDPVEVFADDQKVLTGFIEKISASYDSSSHNITMSGRGKLCDFVDSTISTESLEFQENVSIVEIAKLLLSDIGIDVEVINEAGNIDNFNSFDIESIEIGESGFEFLEKLARKRQILITSDEDGNLVFIRASSTLLNAILKNKIGEEGNNIYSSSIDIDHTNIFNSYIAMSQLNPSNQASNTGHNELASQISIAAVNNQVRSTRKLTFNSEENSDSFTANDRAIWEANIRRSRSISYEAIVQGQSQNSVLWEPNFLVDIDDDFAGISGIKVQLVLLFSRIKMLTHCKLNKMQENQQLMMLLEVGFDNK
jgi:prophage tail gpP-like protein